MVNFNRIPNLNKGNPLNKKAVHVPQGAKATSPGGRSAAATKDPRIDVQIYRSKTGNYAPVGEYFAIVKFYSHAKPDFAVMAPYQFRNKSERELEFEIGVLCGAMAERLGEMYGDNFDPDYASRRGAGQFIEVLRKWAEESTKAA